MLLNSLFIILLLNNNLPDIYKLFYFNKILLLNIAKLCLNDILNFSKINFNITIFNDNTLFLKFLRSRFSFFFSKRKNNNNEILYLQILLI